MAMNCDDPDCVCCHPENVHYCDTPANNAVGQRFTCAECSTAWVSVNMRPFWEKHPSSKMRDTMLKRTPEGLRGWVADRA